MIIYTALLFSIVAACLCVYIIARAQHWYGLGAGIAFAAFLYLYCPWVFLSVYTRYVFLAATVIVIITRLLKRSNATSTPTKKGRVVINLLSAFLFSVMTVLYYTGTADKPYGVAQLSLPFRSGTYFVFQGGWGLPTNVFHYKLRGAVYAMDIVKLNKAGNRASHIFSERLEDYEIYNDTIYSPCDGIVLKAKDYNPDNKPPNRKRGPSNVNQVLIETHAFYVFMAHMKPKGVFVREGDVVHKGQPLGCAGNSGFSIEPHLHIQVHARTNDGRPWYQQPPMKIAFDGRSYLLFETITKN